MTVTVDGEQLYAWKVSTGLAAYDTPDGELQPFRMERDHFWREWDDAPMPYSIFFTQEGHAIHGTYRRQASRPPGLAWLRAAVGEERRDAVRSGAEAQVANAMVVLTGEIPGGGAARWRAPRRATIRTMTTMPPPRTAATPAPGANTDSPRLLLTASGLITAAARLTSAASRSAGELRPLSLDQRQFRNLCSACTLSISAIGSLPCRNPANAAALPAAPRLVALSRARVAAATSSTSRCARAREFVTFRNQDVGARGGIERVAGQRANGSWDTQKWLIGKNEAHIDGS